MSTGNSSGSRALLEKLHGLLADSFVTRLEEDKKDAIPTDAATLGAISKFLKDNEVTADPADNTELADLKQQFMDLQGQRQNGRKATRVLELVKSDLKTG